MCGVNPYTGLSAHDIITLLPTLTLNSHDIGTILKRLHLPASVSAVWKALAISFELIWKDALVKRPSCVLWVIYQLCSTPSFSASLSVAGPIYLISNQITAQTRRLSSVRCYFPRRYSNRLRSSFFFNIPLDRRACFGWPKWRIAPKGLAEPNAPLRGSGSRVA